MFIGRTDEIALIKKTAAQPGRSLLLYGKRKVGKTTLLKNALSDENTRMVYYECIKSSMKENAEKFSQILLKENIIPAGITFTSFFDVFTYLNSLPFRINVVIDEYPYLKKFEQAETVDSLFQNIIDNCLKNISLFISGSHIGMMKDMLEEKNALYGRFDAIIKLKELNYIESAAFYPEKMYYDKIAFYSVFGGSPFVNGCLDSSLSLRENVINTVLNPRSAISNYADNLLMSDLSSSVRAENILHAIANGRKKHKDIESKLGLEKNGLLSKNLKTMTGMELISRVYPINAENDDKKVYYEIGDNLLRFYYTYIYGNKSILETIGAENFYDEYIAPSVLTFISHRFEEMCREYFSLTARKTKNSGIMNVGTFYYDDPSSRTNGEFDVAVKTKNGYEIYEVKYCTDPLKEKDMLKEEKQIMQISGLNITKIGFITVSGVETELNRFKYISAEELYSEILI